MFPIASEMALLARSSGLSRVMASRDLSCGISSLLVAWVAAARDMEDVGIVEDNRFVSGLS